LTQLRPSTRAAAVIESRSRAADWLRRYGVAEAAGICTALLAAWLADALGAPLVAVAYAATMGENVGFYGTIIGRQLAWDRRAARAGGERYSARHLWRTTRELLLEFGPAEVLDSVVVRPLAIGLGVRFLGRDAGVVAGKLAADVSFYLPVILTYELRRRAAGRSSP
jgi:hypothetical protein